MTLLFSLQKNPGMLNLVFVITIVSLLPAPGCFRTSAVEVSDANIASEVITNAFQQWQAGRTVEDMRNAQPPVYIAEDFWTRGYRLADFSVEKPGEPHGTNIRFGMKIRVIDLKGKETSRLLNYLVTTTPALTIAREDH